MKNPKKYIAIAAIAPILFYFWPSSVGGNTDFISVYGDSMKPTMENGALAILKKDAAYNDQDIIAYHYSELGLSKVVIHRIIGKAADGNFVLKGDNNRSTDPETVKPDQIIGKLFFHIPYVGYLPLVMKQPLVLVLTMIALAFFAMFDKTRKNEEGVKTVPKIKEKKKEKAKKSRKQISFFIPALVLNMAYYVMSQYAISLEVLPRDGYTAVLSSFLDPYFASTIAFGSWFTAIMGSFILSKYSISIESRKNGNAQYGTIQVKRQKLIPFKTISQLVWMIFTGYYGLYMFVLISNLR